MWLCTYFSPWILKSWIWPYFYSVDLKTVDTIGSCQTPVFSLAVSQHMHKITNLELDLSSELRENYDRKIHPCTRNCFQMLDFKTSRLYYLSGTLTHDPVSHQSTLSQPIDPRVCPSEKARDSGGRVFQSV